jgi:hypothetical protein
MEHIIRSKKLASATVLRTPTMYFLSFQTKRRSVKNKRRLASAPKIDTGQMRGVVGDGGMAKAELLTVVIVRVVVAALAPRVKDDDVKVQVASTGSPLHAKLMGLVKEPSGVTVKV